MIVLSNGYKLPETGDFGNIWFPAIEDNIQRLNDHTHDGSNSEKLPSTSVEGVVLSLLSGAFSVSGNEFMAVVTIPAAASVDTQGIIFRDPTTKETIYLRIVKISVTQFEVYTSFVQNFEILIV